MNREGSSTHDDSSVMLRKSTKRRASISDVISSSTTTIVVSHVFPFWRRNSYSEKSSSEKPSETIVNSITARTDPAEYMYDAALITAVLSSMGTVFSAQNGGSEIFFVLSIFT